MGGGRGIGRKGGESKSTRSPSSKLNAKIDTLLLLPLLLLLFLLFSRFLLTEYTGDATRIDSWPSESRSAGCVQTGATFGRSPLFQIIFYTRFTQPKFYVSQVRCKLFSRDILHHPRYIFITVAMLDTPITPLLVVSRRRKIHPGWVSLIKEREEMREETNSPRRKFNRVSLRHVGYVLSSYIRIYIHTYTRARVT